MTQPSTFTSSHQTIDDVLNEILTPGISNAQLATTLRSIIKRGDEGDYLLAGLLPQAIEDKSDSGTSLDVDPLSFLDPNKNTLGYLYVLSARLNVQGAMPVTHEAVQSFCQNFDAEAARTVPERISVLAQAIVQYAESQNNLQNAIAPLETLLRRYTPSLAHLTTIHTQFVHACVATRNYSAALPILEVPISEIDTTLSPLSYHDVLNYHYIGALALIATRNYSLASNFLEIVASAPTQLHPSGIQLEALKKLVIVRLMLYGSTRPLPKYTNVNLLRHLKSTPYASFARVFPSTPGVLQEIIDKEFKALQTDCNIGLVRQLVEYGPRWAIRKLTATYVTLSLKEISKAIGVPDEHIVKSIIMSMIEKSEIKATLSGDTVTFVDDYFSEAGLHSASCFSPKEVEKLLKSSRSQGALLAELDRETARSKEFIIKALKEKDASGSMMIDEELFNHEGHGMKDWDD